jgi:predicted aspartyl protease
MIDDMGIFRTRVAVAHMTRPDVRHTFDDVMVDTVSEFNWFPREVLESLGVTAARTDRFETADGRVLERDVGFAYVFAGGRSAVAAVVFAEPKDLTLLGAIGLESLNLRVDLGRKELMPAGPVPAAVSAAMRW